MTQVDPVVVTVTISGPSTSSIDVDVELNATTSGFEGPAAYSWSVESGPASIEPSGSSATVQSSSTGDVVIRVVVDGGTSGSAEDTHTITFGFADGIQKPNDFNGDGNLDISDPIALLDHMFSGGSSPLCGDGKLSHPSNLVILDANASGAIDISDPVFVLGFLFQGGPTPLNCGGDVTCPCILIVDCGANEACP